MAVSDGDGLFFFFNDTATTEIYTLSLHDALPIWRRLRRGWLMNRRSRRLEHSGKFARTLLRDHRTRGRRRCRGRRSEEHTSELQSRQYLVCRLLLEKKKIKTTLLNSITATISTFS